MYCLTLGALTLEPPLKSRSSHGPLWPRMPVFHKSVAEKLAAKRLGAIRQFAGILSLWPSLIGFTTTLALGLLTRVS